MKEGLCEYLKGKINKSGEEPVYRQIADAVREAIEEERVKANERLPAIRKLAGVLGVNNVTVINAYRHLESSKRVYSVVGSGTYVAETVGDGAARTVERVYGRESERQEIKGSVNFAKGSVSPELFPVDEFKELFNWVLSRDKGNAFGYEQSQGYEPLRVNVCGYLETLGIKTSFDKVQIISGAQQGIDVVAKALLSPNDYVLTENPTYYGAVGAFMSRGANVVGVPVEKDGVY